MIRFAWTRFRTQALIGAGVLAIVGAALLMTGIQLSHSYDAAAAVCRRQGNCAGLFNVWPSNGYLTANNILGAVGLAVPGLIGMFWGAPLAAREFETGTFRLAWTQGVTRVRWLAAKIAVAGAAAIAAGELFSLMVNWWASPIHEANAGYNPFTSSSFHAGVAPAAYTAFAFALGVTAGLVIRRTVPAMAVTLALFTAVMIVFPVWVRPHLIPPVHTTSSLNIAAVVATGVGVQGAPPGGLFVQTQVSMPGDWVLGTEIITPAGLPASTEPATRACAGPSATPRSCDAHLERLHLRQAVTYQPGGRYWAFQWLETGIYLALAFALAGFCLWRIRPGRRADLVVRRRARQLTPV
jgi:hypothetical protein